VASANVSLAELGVTDSMENAKTAVITNVFILWF
jgi:hypothetical protein